MTEKQSSSTEHWESIKDVGQQFSQKELQSFTSNFNEKVGSGGFGDVYKGQFPDGGAQVVVKVLKNEITEVIQQQFMAEVSTMGVTCHQNLIKLYGFCFETDMKAIVYEFMENGSLDKVLFNNHLNIDWGKLYDIAIGIAKGLSYLHESCKQKIIHHDIKPANVLLDSKFSPKITDFGLARLCDMDISLVAQSRFRGTKGYAAPEVCLEFKDITSRCDVYSFGMMLFEILRKKKNSDEDGWFPGKVWKYVENSRLDEILIECGINENHRNKAKRLSLVALLCGQQANPQDRPPMSSVVKMLECEIEPQPPSTNPFPFFDSGESSTRGDFAGIITSPAGFDKSQAMQLANLIAVIGRQYCASVPVTLTVVRKARSFLPIALARTARRINDGNLAAVDIKGNIIFRVRVPRSFFFPRNVRLDANGYPLVTLRPTMMTVHNRWKVYRGDSSDDKDHLFSVKESSMFNFLNQHEVFLASNTQQEVCDFKIIGSWVTTSCVVYLGDSPNIIAQLHKNHSADGVVLGKDTYMIRVYPYVDHAFILAVLAYLHKIDIRRERWLFSVLFMIFVMFILFLFLRP